VEDPQRSCCRPLLRNDKQPGLSDPAWHPGLALKKFKHHGVRGGEWDKEWIGGAERCVVK
jgi:hypothetical protein